MTHHLDRGGMPRATLALLIVGGLLIWAVPPGSVNAQDKPKPDAKAQKKPDAKPQAKAEKKSDVKSQPKPEKKADVKPAPVPAPSQAQPNVNDPAKLKEQITALQKEIATLKLKVATLELEKLGRDGQR